MGDKIVEYDTEYKTCKNIFKSSINIGSQNKENTPISK